MLEAPFGIFLSPLKVWEPEVLSFLDNHFLQREMYHSTPMKSLSHVCQSYLAGNEGPLGAQTQVLWRPRKPLPSTGPHPFLIRYEEFLTWRFHMPQGPWIEFRGPVNLDGKEFTSLFSIFSHRKLAFPSIIYCKQPTTVLLSVPMILLPIEITDIFMSHYIVADISKYYLHSPILQN